MIASVAEHVIQYADLRYIQAYVGHAEISPTHVVDNELNKPYLDTPPSNRLLFSKQDISILQSFIDDLAV